MTCFRSVLFACILVTFKCPCASIFTMLSHNQQYIVDTGADLSLSCVFYKDNFNLFDNPIQWKKIQYGDVSEINILGNIKEPFDSTGRFIVTYEPSPPQYIMGLTIKNISLVDSANYTCEVRAPKSTELGIVKYTVYVKDPVEAVYVNQDNTSFTTHKSSLTSVTFIDNKPTRVRCIARGGSPPPEMTIYLGADDYTKYFRFDVISEASGSIGFRTLRMTSVLTSDDIRVTAKDDGKRLNCVAKVPGFNKVVSSASLIVNYGPQIICEKSFANIGDRNVRLLCDVTAKPELTSWLWILDKNGSTISEGEVMDGYWTVVTKTDSTHHLELYIRETSRQSFRIYTLMAENSVAIETRQVPLERLDRQAEHLPRSQDIQLSRLENEAPVHNSWRTNIASSTTSSWLTKFEMLTWSVTILTLYICV